MLGRIRQSGWSIFHVALLLLLLFFAIDYSNSRHSLRMALQYGVFDQFNKLYPRESNGDVIIVDIDEQSLERFGQWPWPRNVMAQLTLSLKEKGAKVIAFDGVFAEEDRASPSYFISHLKDDTKARVSDVFTEIQDIPDYDAIFAQAIKDSDIFVTAFTYGRSERDKNKPVNKNRVLARSDVKDIFLNEASYFRAAAINLPEFAKNAAGNGSFMAKPDTDGVLRRAGMIFTDRTQLYPSLSLEALRIGLVGKKGTVKIAATPVDEKRNVDTNYRILIEDKIIPVESDGILNVYYRYFCNAQDMQQTPTLCTGRDYISAYKLLDDQYAEEAKDVVNGKIILMGASAEGLKDLRSTPLRPFRPGVEVHANVIEQVLSDKYLLRPDAAVIAEGSFILVSGLFFILLTPFIGIIISVLLCATIIGVAMFGAFWMYVDYGLLFDPVYPSIAVAIIFVVSTILSYARAESRRKQIRNAFGMYVSRDVMRDLEDNPDKLKLGGEKRNITVMFTDIRKFTSISEGLAPEELIQLMNDFLTAMTDIVMAHHGTVDKYIGDAMMAFWNAPRDVDCHERKACLAALLMQSKLEPINERLVEQAKEAGRVPVLLQAGIGVNTGVCAVGNMGSRQRFAYSALGDAVNLSSRLEGQTKQYGVSIIVGEDTYEKAKDLAMIELDLIQVVGRHAPCRIYALFGDSEMALSDTFEDWNIVHQQMLQHYRACRFDSAEKMLSTCRKKATADVDVLYDMYESRIKTLRAQNLVENWDGVYIAQHK